MEEARDAPSRGCLTWLRCQLCYLQSKSKSKSKSKVSNVPAACWRALQCTQFLFAQQMTICQPVLRLTPPHTSCMYASPYPNALKACLMIAWRRFPQLSLFFFFLNSFFNWPSCSRNTMHQSLLPTSSSPANKAQTSYRHLHSMEGRARRPAVRLVLTCVS